MEELKYEIRKIKIDPIKILGLILALEGSILKVKNEGDGPAEIIRIIGIAITALASLVGLIANIKQHKNEL